MIDVKDVAYCLKKGGELGEETMARISMLIENEHPITALFISNKHASSVFMQSMMEFYLFHAENTSGIYAEKICLDLIDALKRDLAKRIKYQKENNHV